MANTAYVGAGTTLGTSYYMRRFYAANADARTTTSRSNLSNSTLTGADSHALRRAIRSLGSFTYDDDNETNIKNNVSAFISTYNNMINSSGASDDRTMKNTQKSLKNLTAEYESQLDKIGITVKDNGTLESRSSLLVPRIFQNLNLCFLQIQSTCSVSIPMPDVLKTEAIF